MYRVSKTFLESCKVRAKDAQSSLAFLPATEPP